MPASERAFHRAGVHHHPEGLVDGENQVPGPKRGIRRQPGLGEGHHLVAHLVRAARPRPLRHQRGDATRIQRGRRLVVRRAGEPERLGAAADGVVVDPDPAHHLVLDLHLVPGIQELRGPERLIADRLGPGVEAAGSPQRLDLGIAPACLCHGPSL